MDGRLSRNQRSGNIFRSVLRGLTGQNSGVAGREKTCDELMHAIEALESAGPIAIAAKINVAFDHAHRADYIENLPWSMLASVLRTLLPTLPTDMAAALQPLTAGRRETATPIGQGLRTVGTAALPITGKRA